MSIQIVNGKKTASINVFIDPERGFLDLSLTDATGGVLYVPKGEEVSAMMGDIITKSRGSVFVLGQDYHPANHISFMVNHPGLMEYRIKKFQEFLAANGQPALTDNQLYLHAQQPVHFLNGFNKPPVPFAFNEIVLDDDRNIIGVKEDDGRIRKVTVETSSGLAPSEKDRGRVTAVLDEYFPKTFDEYRAEGQLLSTQTLWTKHGVQGTESSLYPADMNLPKGLQEKLNGDLTSPVVYHRDAATGNEFYVVRKGQNSEVDSYGIGVENDGETRTKADEVFRAIARNFRKQGVENVVINVGGLASNFCVEFSINNIADFFAGEFRIKQMAVELNFVPEISRGIPIPGGPEVPFSEGGVAARVKALHNVGINTIEGILALSGAGKSQAPVRPKFPGMTA